MTDKKVVNQSVVASAAVAGAYALSDKDNQDKVAKVVSDVKKNIMDKKDAVVGKAQKLEDIAKNTVNDVKNIWKK